MPDLSETIELTPSALVAGGDALARDDDGRVVFVAGALPNERVRAEVVERKRDFMRAVITEIIEPSPDRVTPPCEFVAAGCGGCDLQHVDPAHQPLLKRDVVVDALRRLGRVAEPLVEAGPPLPSAGFRTTVRGAVVGGTFGFRASRSHDVVMVDHCLVAHPLVDELVARGRYDGCDEVTIRVGASTGERLVIGDPTAAGIDLPDDIDAKVIGVEELTAGIRAWIHEAVGGQRFRLSALSFFQTRPDGAAALAATVRELGGAELAGASTVVDAYGGVGVLGALAAPAAARLIVVESSASSAADARVNLADRSAKIIRSRVERWRPTTAGAVIADPSRSGLGKDGVGVLASTKAAVITLVSCDAAALGRDTALLAKAGYHHERSVLVDLFPQTHHLEVVTRFVR